ncbi:carotenoid oxygenase family protein [Amycolatopsis sp. H20-H5]|uniref:carotenoid oxygenase family protein n=1 Tax=Amycolatopsis sp. H20-H5 TaxID=3046309 RepID=UPI002DB81512|nr:carotenoid oxygenase family protein [Amycolatopsis sp. H20-H5]MEC3979103.1 carotenoid oxygenase family protein [Amycolatopsis sp. H20-H5]
MANRFLEDNLAPISQEHTITELEVTGSIPAHLDGRYLRNGPNPLSEVDPEAYHWFTGDGMVHGVRLRDGRAEWYRNRWVRGPRAASKLGEPRGPRKPHAGFEAIGANTNVISHAGKTLALVESGLANYELTDELDTVGPCDFDGTLRGGYTAHPKRDPRTGELHAVSYFFGRGNRVQYSVIGVDGRARRTVDVEVAGSPMMHDFSLTENHVVFYDLPVTFDVEQGLSAVVPRFLRTPAKLVVSALLGRVRVPDPITAMIGRRLEGGSGSGFPYSWTPKYPARIGVMPREGGSKDVRWFEVEPCYVFHPLNAYDDGDSIVLDVVRHPRMFDAERRGPGEGRPTLDRWTVDLAGGKVVEERLDDRGQEFPRVDERLVGRQHRYGYAMATDDGASSSGTLLKHDLRDRSVRTRSFGPGGQPGEFVFVPSGEDAAEDDGVLMGFVFDATTGRSDLTLLDAGTLDTVAAIHLPDRVPHGFHGNWAPTAG